jgi:predicted  nucleic acid-binding Zn-ribbon protein
MTQPIRFRYPLEPFLKKHQWEEQALRQELATSRDAYARLQEQQDAISQGVRALNAQIAEMHRGTFDAAHQQRVIAWREQQETLLVAKQREVADAQANAEQVAQHLARTLNAVRGHKSYRGRLEGEHRLECERDAARQVDDAWLLRRTWLENQQ